MSGHKVTEVIQAAASSFKRADVRTVEQELPSKAEALGIQPPRLTDAQLQGYRAQAVIAASRATQSGEVSRYQQERRDAEAARDEAIWARVLARRAAAI